MIFPAARRLPARGRRTSAVLAVAGLLLSGCASRGSSRAHRAVLEAPAVTFAGTATSSGRIPLLDDSDLIVVRGSVNGVATDIVLDTGAEGIALDEAFARRVGLTLEGNHRVFGACGLQRASVASRVDLQIGGFRQVGLTAHVVDFSRLEAAAARPVSVIAGSNLFERTVVEYDPESRTVAFHAPGSFTPSPSAVRLRLERVERRLRAVGVEIEGRPPVLLALDTGCAAPLDFDASYWETERLLDGRLHSTVDACGVGGERECRIATLRTVRFAGTTFHEVTAGFRPRAEPLVAGTQGLLGWPILGRFRWVADYATDSLYLSPFEPDVGKEFPRPYGRSGLDLEREGGVLRVTRVAPGSGGQKAGFRVGERIAAIDGTPVSSLSREALDAIGQRPVGTTLEITLADGRVRRLVLADYY